MVASWFQESKKKHVCLGPSVQAHILLVNELDLFRDLPRALTPDLLIESIVEIAVVAIALAIDVVEVLPSIDSQVKFSKTRTPDRRIQVVVVRDFGHAAPAANLAACLRLGQSNRARGILSFRANNAKQKDLAVLGNVLGELSEFVLLVAAGTLVNIQSLGGSGQDLCLEWVGIDSFDNAVEVRARLFLATLSLRNRALSRSSVPGLRENPKGQCLGLGGGPLHYLNVALAHYLEHDRLAGISRANATLSL